MIHSTAVNCKDFGSFIFEWIPVLLTVFLVGCSVGGGLILAFINRSGKQQ